MNQIFKKLTVIPSIYQGRFVDIDAEINRAYKKYPFPWPNEKQYGDYAKEDALKTLSCLEMALEEFLHEFELDFDFFKDKVVIDLGSGVGWDSFCIARHGAKFVYAIDNCEISIKHGERFAQMLGVENIKFYRSSLYEVDRTQLKGDVIIAKGVLHHIFDLPRFVKALPHISRDHTELLLAHSSYHSRLGFIHYFFNHLAWVFGGADLENRIDVGVRLFRGWHWQLPDTLLRHRVNDLAGVFYMARSSKQIIKIFENEGFSMQKPRGRKFTALHLLLKEHHFQMLEVERHNTLRKIRRFIAISLIETFYFLSKFLFMDRLLGRLYQFLFSMPGHLFLARRALLSDKILPKTQRVQVVTEPTQS